MVGPSGGGKSSCIAMLEHFYEPASGEVLLDGIPIRDYEHKYLHKKVALVGQEPGRMKRFLALEQFMNFSPVRQISFRKHYLRIRGGGRECRVDSKGS